MYYLELINWFLSANNFLRVRSEDAPFIINRSIEDVPDGMYIGVENGINSPLLNHLAAAGYYARILQEKGKKVLEVWVPGLIVFKQVDWSIFQWKGTTIQQHFHQQVDKIVGRHIQRGDRVVVRVNYMGDEYSGFIRNADRNVTSDTYQFFYSADKRLVKKVTSFFGDLVNQLEAHKPATGNSYFELVAAKEPQVVNLNLYNEDLASGIQYEQYIRAFATFNAAIKSRNP